jgi:hypothetical protein
MSFISKTNDNQFGYKNRTSCTHALFIFKETIIQYLDRNMHCFAAFLDAIKAFDNLWRQALYLKLKNNSNSILSTIIILKIYYDKLSSKIRINNMLSKLFNLARGVKQGGVLSGSLFNFFIDDLIQECCQAGLGASFINIIVAIICFCDDICLISPDAHELQLLLNICNNYSKKWALEYNISKFKFIVFGTSKFNNTNFLLNNLSLTYSNKFKYLGIDFTHDLNFSNFFLNKFQSVSKSFFTLTAFGFRPGGINPHLQSFVYKSFCLSRLLYGFEILTVNKSTINKMNVNQNSIIRYMTGLSKKSHISNTRKVLRILSINELNDYMKLIFVKNLKNSKICSEIFNHLINNNYKKNTKSFIKEVDSICSRLEIDKFNLTKDIQYIINNFKEKHLFVDKNIENELIVTCLSNNHDYRMIEQLNLVTYSGPQVKHNESFQ